MAKPLKLPKQLNPGWGNPRVKPIGPVEIDWKNPLTNGLLSVSVGGIPLDLRTRLKSSGIDPDINKNKYYYNGSEYLKFPLVPFGLGEAMTLAFVGESDNNDANNRRALSVTDASDANRRVSISYNNSNTIRLNSHDGTTNALCDLTSVASGDYQGRVAFGALENWADRKIVSVGDHVGVQTNATSLSTANLNTFDTVTVGNRYNSDAPISGEEWKGTQGIAVVWNRNIGEQALRDFLNNPYQILRPANEFYYYPSAGGGGGSISIPVVINHLRTQKVI